MNKKIREEFEKAYPMPFACGWNSMANEYQCIWPEHAGEDRVEEAIDQHNDRLAVWKASRQAIEVCLPSDTALRLNYHTMYEAKDACIRAIHAVGLRTSK
jgi:hypothetical protein